jgi:hypothetical protein
MNHRTSFLWLVGLTVVGVAIPAPTTGEPDNSNVHADEPASKSDSTTDSPDETDSSEPDDSDRADDSSEQTLEELLDSLDNRPERQRERSQQGEDEPTRRRDIPLETLSVAQAREYGFEFGDEARERGGGAAALAALTAGIPLHGAGHLVAGEPRTGWWLAGSEAVGAGLLATGLVGTHQFATGPGYGITKMVGLLGVGILGAGYLADVAGTIPTDGTGLPRNDQLARGFSAEAGYLFRRTNTSPLSHFARAQLRYDGDWWSAQLGTEQEFQWSASSATLTASLHPPVGRSALTHPTVELTGEYLVSRDIGPFRRWSGTAMAGGTLDLAVISPGLRHFAVGGLAGLQRSWLLVGGQSEPAWLPAARAFAHFNVSQRLHTAIRYRLDPDDWLAPDGRLAGIGELAVTFNTDGPLDLVLEGRLGSGVGVVTGLRYQLD